MKTFNNQISYILESTNSTYKPIRLPFSLNALSPIISAKTMNEHYNKHYKNYINKLNEAIKGSKITDIVSLIKSCNSKPDVIKNNAGGFYNHSLFWNMLSPKSTLTGNIQDVIIDNWDNFKGFKEDFTETALKQFGSGWCWLIKDNNKFKIITTANQDNPLMTNKHIDIVLGVDLWEHSFYLDYKSDKQTYLNKVLGIINWEYCNNVLIS